MLGQYGHQDFYFTSFLEFSNFISSTGFFLEPTTATQGNSANHVVKAWKSKTIINFPNAKLKLNCEKSYVFRKRQRYCMEITF